MILTYDLVYFPYLFQDCVDTYICIFFWKLLIVSAVLVQATGITQTEANIQIFT